MKATLEDEVGVCCRWEDSQEGVGGDIVSVCLAQGSESQGFQRAHRFLGSTQHLTGSGLCAQCRKPYKTPCSQVLKHTCVFKILWQREILDLVREPWTAWRKENRQFLCLK